MSRPAMAERRRGMALALVIMSTMVVLGVLLAGLQMASSHSLNVATTYRRHLARCAAEAGVYLAMQKLEETPNFRGRLAGVLAKSGGTYSAELTSLPTAGHVLIRSDGRDRVDGPYVRRLEVSVAPSADSYNALTTEGLIRSSGNTFVNAVRGLLAPVPEPGYMHTNASSVRAIDGTGRLTITGRASTPGTVGDVVLPEKRKDGAEVKRPERPRREDLLREQFREGAIPDGGTVAENLRVGGNALHHGNLRLQGDSVLHVEGNLVVEGGVSGRGKVVTDGNLEIRGANALDLENTQGVVLYSDGDLVIADPSAARMEVGGDEIGSYETTGDPVRDFFARMPFTAPYALGENLPLEAPGGADFFEWYARQSASPSEQFEAWRDGSADGSGGLSADVRQWLDRSIPIVNEIRDWASRS